MTRDEITKERLAELKGAAPSSPTAILAGSGWVDGKTDKERAQIEKEMLERLIGYVDSAKKILGEPDGDTTAVTLWYPSALAGYAWTVDGGVFALCVVHHDKETPIGITLRYVTTEERDALSKRSNMHGYFDE